MGNRFEVDKLKDKIIDGLLHRHCRACLKYKPSIEFKIVKSIQAVSNRVEHSPRIQKNLVLRERSKRCEACEALL